MPRRLSLFDPLTLPCGLVLRNRAALAPLTNKQSHPDGSLGDTELRWLTSRAEGGFGLVFTCAAHVAKDGQGWPGELGIFDDVLLPGLTRLADALHRRGPAAFVQLFHGGVRADSTASGLEPWSATAGDGARAATETDLRRVIDQFANAAARAQAAGFDGVEIHGSHGYLFTQFLSVVRNQRLDEWGGSLANRARLLLDTVAAVRRRVGKAFAVGVRLSPEDFGNARGLDLDESLQVAAWLAAAGVDFVHLSLWQALAHTAKRPNEHPLPIFRAVVPRPVALIAAGSIWTSAEADAVLALGADVVAIGRAAIANPRWATEARQPGWEPRRPPLTIAALEASGLSPAFAAYLRTFSGFVAD